MLTAIAGAAVLAAGIWMIWIAMPGPDQEPVSFMRSRMVAESWPMLSLLVGVAGVSLIVHGIMS